jgi:hypothetical protein
MPMNSIKIEGGAEEKKLLMQLIEDVNTALVPVLTNAAPNILKLYEQAGGQMPIQKGEEESDEDFYGRCVGVLAALNRALMLSCRVKSFKAAKTPATSSIQPNPHTTSPESQGIMHYAKGAVKAAKALTKPETEESKARLEVCKGCDQWTGKSCKVCGCFVNLKVRIPEEKCPIGKW